ncbi:MAG: hypothetical protein PGN33_22005 [Methylobacterium radiotolerans]
MTDVYWNRRKRCWSLRERGRVIGHAEEVHLHDVRFVVSLSAVLRYRRTDTREVCAVARGTLGYRPRDGRSHELRFNPDVHETFMTGESTQVRGCRFLFLSPEGAALAWGLE